MERIRRIERAAVTIVVEREALKGEKENLREKRNECG